MAKLAKEVCKSYGQNIYRILADLQMKGQPMMRPRSRRIKLFACFLFYLCALCAIAICLYVEKASWARGADSNIAVTVYSNRLVRCTIDEDRRVPCSNKV